MPTIPLRVLIAAQAALQQIRDLPLGVAPTTKQWAEVLTASCGLNAHMKYIVEVPVEVTQEVTK